MFTEIIRQLVGKFLSTQERLTANFSPDCLADSPLNELTVLLLRLPFFPLKLTGHPVSRKTGMTTGPLRKKVLTDSPVQWILEGIKSRIAGYLFTLFRYF